MGSLYYLSFSRDKHHLNVTTKVNKEWLWHRRYGQLSEQNLPKLSRKGVVEGFDCHVTNSIGFCETCIGGKYHRSPFKPSKRQVNEPLELVHTDVCGEISEKSTGSAEYFMTFTDEKTHYSWVYFLKTKDQAFDRFQEWKAMVEKVSGKKLKTLRSDNGGEYTSKMFEAYLKSEGIRHEQTIPKTPQQNGVAERLNRTLVELSRSMLLDAALPM